MRTIMAFLLATIFVFLLPAVVLAAILLVSAETLEGRLFALAVLTMSVSPVFFRFALLSEARPRVWAVAASVLFLLGVASLGYCAVAVPRGVSGTDSSLRSVFLTHDSSLRFSPAKLVPEIDQLKLGGIIMPFLDRYVDSSKGRRIRRVFLKVYGELRRDSDFINAGSVLNYTYREIFGCRPEGEHLYLYLPKHTKEETLPVVLFLHGSLGNFKGYLWVWKAFADQQRVAIVAPSFGAGNWARDGGMEVIEAARNFCEEHPKLDHKRIILAGLSNGGTGVSRAARETPEAYRGLIFLSAVLERKILGSERFISGWKGREILMLHGSQDLRIPPESIDYALTLLRDHDVKLTTRYFEEEDHFLFFSRRKEVLNDIAVWMEQVLKNQST